MESEGGADVRTNEERRICSRIESGRCRRMDFSQGASHCKRNLHRKNEGLLYGADKKRQSLALFRYQEGALTLESEALRRKANK